MRMDRLESALAEAARFIDSTIAVKRRVQENLKRPKDAKTYPLTGCKETAACLRASMDLTRTLAELRKP